MSGSDLPATQPPDSVSQSPDTTYRPTLVTGQQQPQQPQQHQQQQQPQQVRQPESAPFQSQLEYLSQSQQQLPHNIAQYAQQPYDMAAVAGALPPVGPHVISSRPFVNSDPSHPISSPSPYQASPQTMYTQLQRPQFADPTMLVRAQQQQQQFIQGGQYGGPSPIQRQQAFPMPPQVPFSSHDPYGFGMSPISPMVQGFAPQPPFMMPPGMPADLSMFARRGSAADNSPVPNFPRGPPRKPKQSGHALWVGNLPPAAQVTDLKDHFSRDATNDIESVFLIAKSNCAFVNYKTEAACVAAMNRFHDSRFHGVRLVCRLRRGTASATATTPTDDSFEAPAVIQSPAPGLEPTDDPVSPTIARSQSGQSVQDARSTSPNSVHEPAPGEKVLEKYFIVKSLTAQDLEASVRNGIWATQSHNENALNRAYEQAETVFLIFSANKSGEYFGYARMASAISGEAVNLSSLPAAPEPTAEPSVSPQSIPTPATATAPKGRIIDDSARGTIFWEADHSEEDESAPAKDGSSSSGQNWGKQFSIVWMSTNRLPFYRTRGLRNPWNANREVKIARDGTELEPSVGRRLVQMFHRPSPSPSQGPMVAPGVNPAGMPYR